MKKKTKILVPIDFSNAADNALAFAFRLADKINATVEVLHVTTPDSPPLDYPSFVMIAVEEKIRLSRQSMNKTLKRVRKDVSTLLDSFPDVQTDIEVGVPSTKIVDIALRDQVNFIVMGMQGKNSRWDRMFGSTTVSVLKYSPCPVFVIPERAKFREEMVVGYATDFLDADPFEIWKASKLLQNVQSKMIAIHLNDQAKYSIGKIEEMENFFAENAPSIDIKFYSILSKDMGNDLNSFVDLHNINLMVMYKPKRNFFERIFYKSFTKEMTLSTEVPLLIFKEK